MAVKINPCRTGKLDLVTQDFLDMSNKRDGDSWRWRWRWLFESSWSMIFRMYTFWSLFSFTDNDLLRHPVPDFEKE